LRLCHPGPNGVIPGLTRDPVVFQIKKPLDAGSGPAFGYYQDALAAAKKSGNQDLIATNLFNVGVIAGRTFHQHEKALSLLEESAQLFKKLNDQGSLGVVLFNTGKVLNALGRYPRALATFNESLRINERLRNQPALAGNLNLIGNTYAQLGKNNTALSY